MDLRNDKLYSGEEMQKLFGDNIPDHVVPVPDDFAKYADALLDGRGSADVDMSANTPLTNWAKGMKTFAWIARYKGVTGCAVVISRTPAGAKSLFHSRINGGDEKDIRLTDQVKAYGMLPDVITDTSDFRFKALGYKVGEDKEPEPPVKEEK